MTRTLRRSLLALSLFAFAAAPLLTVASDAKADTATTSATAFLKAKHETVQSLLKGNAPDKDAQIDTQLDALLDYDQMSQDALGAEWTNPKRTDAEKAQFKDLLKKLIKKNYKKRLVQTLDYQIDYTGENAKGDLTTVHTTAQNLKDKREEPVQIDYVVKKTSSGFIVTDLTPEGASMIQTYKKEFKKVIDKDGWDAVIKRMQDKLAKP